MTIKELIENKSILNYQQICTSLIQTFRVDEKVNWESVLPAQQQQEYFGGETLRLIAEHPVLSKQKDIRPIALKKGSISQMLFFYVCLNDSSLPKKQIQDVTKKFISGGDANRYIIWFFGNKENTQLKVVLSAKEGKKVVLKTLPFGIEQPYYKTYNFILNEINQKVNGLFVEPTDLWKALWEAFDISIINRNFYDEIKGAFTELLRQLNKRGTPFTNEEDKVQFAIRLIGRIIFCWFLKRKEVLHDEAISSEAVKTHSQKNYYHDLLEPLFFDVLNTPNKERKGGLLKIIAHYPFLNGGLFEAQETDYKDHLLLQIDNDWFFSLFSKTLERYNFTVDENSSSNAEIAIDPEMLGRIFENLLAEQNPETGDSARKATGSFYTPREIVDYMVEQSVAEFLKTALAMDEKINVEIEDFVHTQILPDALAKHEERISEELSKIKVLDPACGSGAFPIGILQKIVALKQQLHPKTKNYKLKLDTIQNSIYGVDIQPMAVELSRLRCWLSLVVDEDPKDIKALPNLDFKFVCADSLMEVGKIKQINIGNSTERIEELKILRSEFFIANGQQKKELEKKFRQIQTSLNNNFLEWDGKSKLVENLASWKPFDNHKTEWFDAFWMFGLNDGFDVVIANPPYGNIFKDKELFKKIKLSFDTAEYKIDAYTVFTERAQTFLSKTGIICFITPYTFLSGIYFSKFRNFLNKFNLKQLIVLGKKVFEAAEVDTCIFILKNSTKKENVKIGDFRTSNSIAELVDFNPTTLKQEELFGDSKNLILVTTKVNLNVFIKICAGKYPLLNYVEFYHGIQSRGDEDAITTTPVKNSMPLLKGKDFNKYVIYPDKRYFIFKRENIKSGGNLSFHHAPEKIIIRTTSDKIIAAIDTEKHLVLNSVNIAIPKSSSLSLKYLLAILNSKLINFWYQLSVQEPGKTFAEVKIVYLERIPIVDPGTRCDLIFQKLVDYIVFLKENEEISSHSTVSNNQVVKALDDIVDGMVLEVYFEEEMKEKGLNIVALVESELQNTKRKDIGESIHEFYKVISHPDSEIRNRILSFPIVSPDILKPILQG